VDPDPDTGGPKTCGSGGLNIDFSLKGQRHEMDIFFNVLNILISTFCVFVDGFQGLSKLSTTLYSY
jgi:hypothetical protein